MFANEPLILEKGTARRVRAISVTEHRYDQKTVDRRAFNLRRAMCRIGLFALSCALIVRPSAAQAVNGSIYGTVTDPSGAVIRRAAVTVTNTQTSESRTAGSDASGAYSFLVLDPGDYDVNVKLTGFRSQTQTSIRLDANQNVRIDFTLHVGSLEQNETVEATGLVDTRESQIGDTVDPETSSRPSVEWSECV